VLLLLSIVILNVVMLSVVHAEYLRKAFYAENHYGVIMLSVVAPNISYLILLFCA